MNTTIAQIWPWQIPPWLPLAVLVGFLAASLTGFALFYYIRGRPHSGRVEQVGGSALLGGSFMEAGVTLMRPIALAAARMKVHPDQLTWVSLLMHFAAAYALVEGHFGWGGWLMLGGAVCDSLDGAVARLRGVASDEGELIDAAVDRWAEMAVFFSLAWYYRDSFIGFASAVSACAGAVMVSYTRAKGEAMGVAVKGGLMQRHERAAYLVAATILASLGEDIWPSVGRPQYVLVMVVLSVIAVLANVTSMKRVISMRGELRKR